MVYHTCASFLKILWLEIQIFPQLQSVLGNERETSSLEALEKVVQIFFLLLSSFNLTIHFSL